MPCYKPLTGYRGDKGVSGKRRIVFSLGAASSPVPLVIPCGRCVGCRLEKSRQWAMRCLHENKLHDKSCFVTLTYKDACLPPGGTLVKRDLQLFMKRLRFVRNGGVRFYACGEYGEEEFRPHYHAILFGVDFPDMKYFKMSKSGDKLYISKELEDLWGLGQCLIGAVTFESAAYVARYVMKKVTGPRAASHYQVTDWNGEVHDRIPEFTVMSRRPGIGFEWYRKHGDDVYKHDSVMIRGKPVRPPRYYDLKQEVLDKLKWQLIERKRKREKKYGRHPENLPDRRRVREKYTLAQLASKRREL